MIITDTHTHLYSEAFDEDREEMISRALQANITRFFIPAIDSSYSEAMFELENKFPNNIFLMSGLHPTHVKENFRQELTFVEKELSRRKYYAVGEIGIDLYWDKTTLGIQQEAFKTQIRLAKKHQLPIVIHCREAFNEVFEVLESEAGEDLFGIFHCFTGNHQQAEQALSFNMKLGIGGVATFKNGKVDKFLSEIPLSEIVLETDSPYLAPVPYRGKRNESSYLVNVLNKVAGIYNTTPEEVAAVTTQNSKDIFGV
ncbi:TatD family hydrolase [Salinimicrobium marinum]|uniref:TatD family hydrolase n=1 Tax=Salinimicrobium marinum TaxID=680283 RepID=A0A918S552_9FLAO|nr:TatD family hydrolase [Salinimicrobium marinum]GHA23727.1 TatD family hydrolase [Salinimicrobium marinum]